MESVHKYAPAPSKVLSEARAAGYDSIELGPWNYFGTDPVQVTDALQEHSLSIVAGTIFDDLVSKENHQNTITLTHQICGLLSKIPTADKIYSNNYPNPYLVIIDFGSFNRTQYAGQYNRAPRLDAEAWNTLIKQVTAISTIAYNEFGIRPVIHPHAGGCIEFSDEVERVFDAIPYEVDGLCLDTGHFKYSGIDWSYYL